MPPEGRCRYRRILDRRRAADHDQRRTGGWRRGRLAALVVPRLDHLPVMLRDEALPPHRVGDLLDHVEPLEGILAVIDTRLVQRFARLTYPVDAIAEATVDGRAAHDDREAQSTAVQFLRAERHL